MNTQLPDLVLYSVAGTAIALFVLIKLSRRSELAAIPTVGSSSWLGSWWAGLRFLGSALDIIQEGYEKHKSAPFKVSQLHQWLVIVSSREHVEELRRAPDDTFSFSEAMNDILQVEYTLGHEVHYNPYHVPIVRSQLTRNIGARYPDIRNEIVIAFDEILGLTGNEWKGVTALDTIQQVTCRTSNRLFVGLPLCRNTDWIDLNIRHTVSIVKSAIIMRLFPDSLKPMVLRFCTGLPQNNLRARKLLSPMIEERRRYLEDYGKEWVDKPNDFLSWLMDEAEGPESTVELLTNRVLAINFAAIHTTSTSFTHVLIYLAANPQYVRPLREEVESVIEKEGWSKASLSKMRKVDSFIKECQRLEGISGLTMSRKALKDYTFSGGTFIPKGTTVAVASRSIHYNGAFYENASTFEPFRFADLREEDGESVKHPFAATTPEYLPFGHGRHACPGRFFTANELKSMLAHIVTTYDVKLPDGVPQPKSLRFMTELVPDASAKVMFRKRVE